WAALRARLYDLEMKKRNQAIQDAHDAKADIGWGHQIRSYVLQPYQMVKDLRTGVETSDTQGVLDGELDRFMAAALAQDVSGKSRAEAEAAAEAKRGSRPERAGRHLDAGISSLERDSVRAPSSRPASGHLPMTHHPGITPVPLPPAAAPRHGR